MVQSIQQWCKDWGMSDSRYSSVTDCVKDQHDGALQVYWAEIWKGFRDTDNMFTISDVTAWTHAIFYLPGNLIIYIVTTMSPQIHDFLEISTSSFNGFGAASLSVLSYFIAGGSIWLKFDDF